MGTLNVSRKYNLEFYVLGHHSEGSQKAGAGGSPCPCGELWWARCGAVLTAWGWLCGAAAGSAMPLRSVWLLWEPAGSWGCRKIEQVVLCGAAARCCLCPPQVSSGLPAVP